MSPAMLELPWRSFLETLVMTGASGAISLALGLPLALLLVATDKGGIWERPAVNRVLGGGRQRRAVGSVYHPAGRGHSADEAGRRHVDRCRGGDRSPVDRRDSVLRAHRRSIASRGRPRTDRSGAGHGRQPLDDYPRSADPGIVAGAR
jgi:hypothetical protein